MKPESSLPHSQVQGICPYPEQITFYIEWWNMW